MPSKTLKVTCDSDVRRLKIDLPDGMEQAQKTAAIYDAVANGFSIPASSFSLLYEDEERDMCTLHVSTASDFLGQAGAAKSNSVIRLFLRKLEDWERVNEASSKQEVKSSCQAENGMPVGEPTCGGWVWKPSLADEAVRRLKALARESDMQDMDVSSLSECFLHAMPNLARLAFLKQCKIDMRGVELRDELLVPLAKLRDQLDDAGDMAPPKEALNAYLDGSQPNNFGDAFTILLQTWSQQAQPALQVAMQNVAKDLLALLLLLFPRMFGRAPVSSAKQALMMLQEALANQHESSADAGDMADLLVQSLPILLDVAYWRQSMIDWRGIERRSDLIAPLSNLAGHINDDTDASGCLKAMLSAYLNDTHGDCLGRFLYALFQDWADTDTSEAFKETMRSSALDLAKIFPVILPGMFCPERKHRCMKRLWHEAFAGKGKGKHICAGKAWKGKGKAKGWGKGNAKGFGSFWQGMGLEEQQAAKHDVEVDSDFEGKFKCMRIGKGAQIKGKSHWSNAPLEHDDIGLGRAFPFEGNGHDKGKAMRKGKAKAVGKGWAKGKGKGWWLRPWWGSHSLMDHDQAQPVERCAEATTGLHDAPVE